MVLLDARLNVFTVQRKQTVTLDSREKKRKIPLLDAGKNSPGTPGPVLVPDSQKIINMARVCKVNQP